MKKIPPLALLILFLGVLVWANFIIEGNPLWLLMNQFDGKPASLKDGVYEVRIIAVLAGNEGDALGVLVLKENEETPAVPRYAKIPCEMFRDIIKYEFGEEMIIRIRSVKAAPYREATIVSQKEGEDKIN